MRGASATARWRICKVHVRAASGLGTAPTFYTRRAPVFRLDDGSMNRTIEIVPFTGPRDLAGLAMNTTGPVPAECHGGLQNARAMANHSSPRTTNLYDRREDVASLDEYGKVGI
jgi:hypothetical protein